MGTLSFFEEAKIVFKKNNYLKSAELFESAIKSEGLSLDDQVYAWERIRLIYQNLKKELSLSSLQQLANLYCEAGAYDKAGEVFNELFERTKEAFYLNESYKNSLRNGAIKESKDLARAYIKILIREKRPNDIFEFISENSNKLDHTEIVIWRANGHLLSGNREAFIEEYTKYEKVDHISDILLQEYIRYSEKKTHYWQSDKVLQKLVFEKLTEDSTHILISKKQVAKLILNTWMEEGINQDLIISTVRICERFGLNVIGTSIAQYMGDSELAERFKRDLDESILTQEVDFGADLFEEEEINEEVQIARNIEFLKSVGKEEDIEREVAKLKKINPNHELVSNEVRVSNLRPEHIYKDLMSELSRYSSSENSENLQEKFNALASFYEWEYIQNNYEDMIVGLNLLSLSQVAFDVAERVDIKLLSEEERINLEYLKLETLMQLEKYFSVRDGVDDMINNFPIKGNELLSLLYLRAEALLGLKQLKNAYFAFLEIFKINNNYRLVRQRLKELEKHK